MNDKAMKLEEMISYGSKEAVIQNLKDAGCAPDVIGRCISCMEQGRDKAKPSSRNESCREEKNQDCLDYLVYQIARCLKESE